jgi:hypothetical protein
VISEKRKVKNGGQNEKQKWEVTIDNRVREEERLFFKHFLDKNIQMDF